MRDCVFSPCLFLCHVYGPNIIPGCDAVEKVLYAVSDYLFHGAAA